LSSSRIIQTALEKFIESEMLPAAYLQTVEQWYIPLAQDILDRLSFNQGTFILGIHGCQGSGKSTLAALLVLLLQEMQGVSSINLSLDDFYLTRSKREQLAADVHPLLLTRGVPGTHDVGLAIQTLKALSQSGEVAIPRFNKVVDDRMAESEWPLVKTPVDVVIIEGWCLGISPQTQSELQAAVNSLESEEDQGEWRAYVNAKLADEYQDLFKLIDLLIMLKAPDFSNTLEWRLQQENKLKRNNNPADSMLMNEDELKRFISHYERLTRHALRTVPATADMVYQLNDKQGIQAKLKG
jgi:D-glycerate 3-kinase